MGIKKLAVQGAVCSDKEQLRPKTIDKILLSNFKIFDWIPILMKKTVKIKRLLNRGLGYLSLKKLWSLKVIEIINNIIEILNLLFLL